MKPRSPVTPGGAFTRVKDLLTAKVCAEFLGVTEWTIYDRCDAQDIGKLNLSWAQMFALDQMCREKCGEEPLTELHNEKMAACPRATASESLQTAGVELARDVGEVEAEILSLGDNDRPLSNRKVIDLQGSLQKVKRCVAA